MHFVTFEGVQISGIKIPTCWNLELLVYGDAKPSLNQHYMNWLRINCQKTSNLSHSSKGKNTETR